MLGIYLARGEEEVDSFVKKLIQYGVLIICISIIITVYQISKGQLNISQDIEGLIKSAYDVGSKGNIGGGAVGALCAGPLINLIGKVSTVILSIRCGNNFLSIPVWSKACRKDKRND
jgi:hypothetical protein